MELRLPYELLEIIFDHLKTEDLKCLLHLGGYLREVITTSPLTMRKLKLLLSENWREKLSFVRDSGECVKTLEFDRCNFEDPGEFRDVLRMMKNIENLKISNVHITAENFNKKFKVLALKFTKINSLNIDNSQAAGKLYRLYMKNLRVEELTLDFCHYNVTTEFVRLLQYQHSLKTLQLSGFNNILYQSLFQTDISYTFWFQLHRLIINHRVTKNEFFLKFLKALTSLQQLEVHKEIEIQEFFNTIFEMPNLRSLTLATNFVTLKSIDFKKTSNSQIEELILITRSQYGIEQTINYLITKLLNLKTLRIFNIKTDSSDQLLGYVHLKKLKNLQIENSKLKFLQNVKFDCLRSLHLNKIHPFLKFEDWENFLKINSRLEEIVISEIEVYYVIESIKIELEKIIHNLHYVAKTLKHFKIDQELRYQKPMRVLIRVCDNDAAKTIMKVSDSFIKICRDEFQMLRKLNNFVLSYYDDDCLTLNNKYLK